MYVPMLTRDTFIQLPFVAPPGSDSVSNYTFIMDVLVPSDSTAPAKFLDIFDRWGNMIFTTAPTPAGEVLSLGGTVGGTPFNLVSPMPLPLGQWARIAFTVETDETFMTLSLYLDGKFAGSTSFNATPGALVFRPSTSTWLFSSPDGTDGELYASSIQFHTVAFTPEMIAELGSPDNGPILLKAPPEGVPPIFTTTISNGAVNISWAGSEFVLQETSDLTRGVWVDSGLPFDEA